MFEGDERLGIHFEYFQKHVVPQTNYYLESSFWNRLVFQLCHREPSVKHAVIALSSLHQYWELNGSVTSYEGDQNALRNHQKALEHAKDLLTRAQSVEVPDKDDIIAILAVCILFICFEHTVGRYSESVLHLINGRKILHKYFPPYAERIIWNREFVDSHDVAELEDVFYRLQVSTVCFSQTSNSLELNQVFLKGKRAPLPDVFASVQEARRHLILIDYRSLVIVEADRVPERVLDLDHCLTHNTLAAMVAAEKGDCLEDLQRWSELFRDLSGRASESEDFEFGESESVYDFVRVFNLGVRISVNAEFTRDEMAYDAFVEDFRVLADYLKTMTEEQDEQGWFSLEAKLLPLIFFCATKCREPNLRRQAISMLAMSKVREGGWEGIAATRVAERFMALEEEGPTVVRGPEDIPRDARVRILESNLAHDQRKIEIRIQRDGIITQELIYY